MSTIEREVVSTERTERAAASIYQALNVLKGILTPKFCDELWSEVEAAWTAIEVSAAYNLAEGERAAWALVIKMSRLAAPLYLSNTRITFNKYRYNVLPTEMVEYHSRGLDKASDLIGEANDSISKGDDRQAGKLLKEAIEISKTIYREEMKVSTLFFAERATQSAEEAAMRSGRQSIDPAVRAAAKARYEANKAERVEANRKRAGKSSGSKDGSSKKGAKKDR